MTDHPSDESHSDQEVLQSFDRAVRLEQDGNWPAAIELYEQLAQRLQGQQDGVYAANCASQLRERVLERHPTEEQDNDADVDVHECSRRGKRRALGWIVAIFAINGLLEGLLPEDKTICRMIDLATVVLTVILILRWCEYDRWEKRISPWRHFTPLMATFPGPLIMVPLYLLRTRGIRGVRSLAKAAIFWAMAGAAGGVSFVAGKLLALLTF